MNNISEQNTEVKTGRINMKDVEKWLEKSVPKSDSSVLNAGKYKNVLKLLSRGNPVSISDLSNEINVSEENVRKLLQMNPDAEFNADGNLVGLGLTLNPTAYKYQVDGRTLYTWCAFDTLMFAKILEHSVIIRSKCPASKVDITIEVSPAEILKVTPETTVVSFVTPSEAELCCGIRDSFCNQVEFFAGPEAASSWLEKNKRGNIMSLNESNILADKVAKLID